MALEDRLRSLRERWPARPARSRVARLAVAITAMLTTIYAVTAERSQRAGCDALHTIASWLGGPAP